MGQYLKKIFGLEDVNLNDLDEDSNDLHCVGLQVIWIYENQAALDTASGRRPHSKLTNKFINGGWFKRGAMIKPINFVDFSDIFM